MVKKKKAAIPHPRKRRKEAKPSLFWYGVVFLAMAGAVILLSCVGLSNWRVTEEFTAHWLNKDKPVRTRYGPSSYGLYLVRFDNGSQSTPWFRLAQVTCTAVDAMAPLLQGIDAINLFDASCDSNCLNHFRTRCGVYRSETTLGYATMGVIILGAVAALVGVGWFFVVSISPAMCNICWTGTGVAICCMIVWYMWSTDYDFKLLNNRSIFPYASCGAAFYAACVGAAFILVAGILSSVASYFQRRAEWKEKQDKIRQAVIEDAGGLELGGFETPRPSQGDLRLPPGPPGTGSPFLGPGVQGSLGRPPLAPPQFPPRPGAFLGAGPPHPFARGPPFARPPAAGSLVGRPSRGF